MTKNHKLPLIRLKILEESSLKVFRSQFHWARTLKKQNSLMNTLQFLNFTFINESTVENFLRNCSFCTLFFSMMFYWIQTAFSFSITPPPLSITRPSFGNREEEEEIRRFGFLGFWGGPTPIKAPPKWPYSNQGPPKTALIKVGPPQKPKADKGFFFESLEWQSQFVALKKTTPPTLRTGTQNLPISSPDSTPKAEAPFLRFFSHKLTNFGTFSMILSNFLLMFLLIFRWRESGHFPLSNLYESLMFLSWSCTFIHLILEYQTAFKIVRTDATLVTKLIGSITSPSALFTNAFATFSLPLEMQKASPLVPALQSNWLMMHVTVMIISYSALILGSLLSIAFLILININPSTQKPSAVQNVLTMEMAGVPQVSQIKKNFAWNFDNLSYRVVGIGFPFLTIGILSGAVWANEAWGSYWSWDPKETWALLTWLIFAIYLHARITKGWQGKKPAIIASFGFLAIWVCFLGVNLIGEGLHSYGWFS